MRYRLKNILIAVTVATLVTVPSVYADNAYRRAAPRGWLWYEETPAQPKPVPRRPPAPQPAAPVRAAQPESTGPELFSAAWVRQQLPILLDRAMTNPTEENVRAYKYMERVALDMSTNYANMSEQVVRTDPMLDESVRFPISSMARAQALSQISRAREGIIRDLRSKAGLWLFFDSQCHFCHSQFAVTRMLSQKYGLPVRYISTDGGVIQGMPATQLLYDRGASRARSLGIKLTPAVVLVAPPDKMAIVAHGAMSQAELEEKIVLSAIDMQIANPELSNIAKLQDRGILTPGDMADVRRRIRNPNNTDELVKMLNEMIQRRM